MIHPMYSTVFAVFALVNSTQIFNCVTIDKIAWNEHMSPVKHIHIIMGKFLIIPGFKGVGTRAPDLQLLKITPSPGQ